LNRETIYEAARPRHRVWVKAEELTAGADEGTYTLTDAAAAAELGFGSEIYVIDKPGTLLFWDNGSQSAHLWAGSLE